MADLDALRATIEQRRAELQGLRQERDNSQQKAAELTAERVLKSELATVEREIQREKDLLDSQNHVIEQMTRSVIAEQEQHSVVVGTEVGSNDNVNVDPVDPSGDVPGDADGSL